MAHSATPIAPASMASLTICWDLVFDAKQTLFPVYSLSKDSQVQAHKGSPPDNIQYSLRATKGVNMYPPLVLSVHDTARNKISTQEQVVKLSLVSAVDYSQVPEGSCGCGGPPTVAESKQTHLTVEKNGLFATFSGSVEFSKLHMACCTGARGHGVPLMLKAEFMSSTSPLVGMCVYSPPIDVGAKGPFAKIFLMKDQLSMVSQSNPKLAAQGVGDENAYPGAEEMLALLKDLNLQKYKGIFVHHEIDVPSLVRLSEQNLISMGISKVGPRLKIMKAIESIKSTLKAPLLSTNTVSNQTISKIQQQHIAPTSTTKFAESHQPVVPPNPLPQQAQAQKRLQKQKPHLQSLQQQAMFQQQQQQQQQQMTTNSRAKKRVKKQPASLGIQIEQTELPPTPIMTNTPSNGNTDVSTLMEGLAQNQQQQLPNTNSENSGLNQPSPHSENSPFEGTSRSPAAFGDFSKRVKLEGTANPYPPLENLQEDMQVQTMNNPFSLQMPELHENMNFNVYIFLSNILASPTTLKKMLFMVKTRQPFEITNQIMQIIHREKLDQLYKKSLAEPQKQVFHDSEAQLMLVLEPSSDGGWMARSETSGKLWPFQTEDSIKIDNLHNMDVSIVVHHYFIPDQPLNLDTMCPSVIEEAQSPKTYPKLFPGGSLEIGVGGRNVDGRVSLASDGLDGTDDTFAITHRGRLVSQSDILDETCIFSFKRKHEMKRVNTLDELQREEALFFARFMDPISFG